MKRTVLLMLAVAMAASAAMAQTASLTNLAWMSGRWVDDSGGNFSEEIWTAPSGDSMMGMWRMVAGGKAKIFELLSIKAESDGIIMRLRHFDPRLVAREEREKPVELTLVGWKAREARFEGPAVGASGLVSLTYRRSSDDTLTCTLEKEGKKEEYSFRRAP